MVSNLLESTILVKNDDVYLTETVTRSSDSLLKDNRFDRNKTVLPNNKCNNNRTVVSIVQETSLRALNDGNGLDSIGIRHQDEKIAVMRVSSNPQNNSQTSGDTETRSSNLFTSRCCINKDGISQSVIQANENISHHANNNVVHAKSQQKQENSIPFNVKRTSVSDSTATCSNKFRSSTAAIDSKLQSTNDAIRTCNKSDLMPAPKSVSSKISSVKEKIAMFSSATSSTTSGGIFPSKRKIEFTALNNNMTRALTHSSLLQNKSMKDVHSTSFVKNSHRTSTSSIPSSTCNNSGIEVNHWNRRFSHVIASSEFDNGNNNTALSRESICQRKSSMVSGGLKTSPHKEVSETIRRTAEESTDSRKSVSTADLTCHPKGNSVDMKSVEERLSPPNTVEDRDSTVRLDKKDQCSQTHNHNKRDTTYRPKPVNNRPSGIRLNDERSTSNSSSSDSDDSAVSSSRSSLVLHSNSVSPPPHETSPSSCLLHFPSAGTTRNNLKLNVSKAQDVESKQTTSISCSTELPSSSNEVIDGDCLIQITPVSPSNQNNTPCTQLFCRDKTCENVHLTKTNLFGDHNQNVGDMSRMKRQLASNTHNVASRSASFNTTSDRSTLLFHNPASSASSGNSTAPNSEQHETLLNSISSHQEASSCKPLYLTHLLHTTSHDSLHTANPPSNTKYQLQNSLANCSTSSASLFLPPPSNSALHSNTSSSHSTRPCSRQSSQSTLIGIEESPPPLMPSAVACLADKKVYYGSKVNKEGSTSDWVAESNNGLVREVILEDDNVSSSSSEDDITVTSDKNDDGIICRSNVESSVIPSSGTTCSSYSLKSVFSAAKLNKELIEELNHPPVMFSSNTKSSNVSSMASVSSSSRGMGKFQKSVRNVMKVSSSVSTFKKPDLLNRGQVTNKSFVGTRKPSVGLEKDIDMKIRLPASSSANPPNKFDFEELPDKVPIKLKSPTDRALVASTASASYVPFKSGAYKESRWSVANRTPKSFSNFHDDTKSSNNICRPTVLEALESDGDDEKGNDFVPPSSPSQDASGVVATNVNEQQPSSLACKNVKDVSHINEDTPESEWVNGSTQNEEKIPNLTEQLNSPSKCSSDPSNANLESKKSISQVSKKSSFVENRENHHRRNGVFEAASQSDNIHFKYSTFYSCPSNNANPPQSSVYMFDNLPTDREVGLDSLRVKPQPHVSTCKRVVSASDIRRAFEKAERHQNRLVQLGLSSPARALSPVDVECTSLLPITCPIDCVDGKPPPETSREPLSGGKEVDTSVNVINQQRQVSVDHMEKKGVATLQSTSSAATSLLLSSTPKHPAYCDSSGPDSTSSSSSLDKQILVESSPRSPLSTSIIHNRMSSLDSSASSNDGILGGGGGGVHPSAVGAGHFILNPSQHSGFGAVTPVTGATHLPHSASYCYGSGSGGGSGGVVYYPSSPWVRNGSITPSSGSSWNNHHFGSGSNGNGHMSNGNIVDCSSSSVVSVGSFASSSGGGGRRGEHYGSISSLASSTSLISPQELQGLIDDANISLEESGTPSHEIMVIVLHREFASGSIGITLAGGADYECKEITVHKIIPGTLADRDGRIMKGDRVLSINGKSMKGVTHREALAILKAPRAEVVLVLSRPRSVTPAEFSSFFGIPPNSMVSHPQQHHHQTQGASTVVTTTCALPNSQSSTTNDTVGGSSSSQHNNNSTASSFGASSAQSGAGGGGGSMIMIPPSVSNSSGCSTPVTGGSGIGGGGLSGMMTTSSSSSPYHNYYGGFYNTSGYHQHYHFYTASGGGGGGLSSSSAPNSNGTCTPVPLAPTSGGGGLMRPPKILESPIDPVLREKPFVDVARHPPTSVILKKEGTGLGFSLEGGKDSPLGDRPLTIKKIFTGGAADRSKVLRVGDEIIAVNNTDCTRMSRIEAWNFMKKLSDGTAYLLVRQKVGTLEAESITTPSEQQKIEGGPPTTTTDQILSTENEPPKSPCIAHDDEEQLVTVNSKQQGQNEMIEEGEDEGKRD